MLGFPRRRSRRNCTLCRSRWTVNTERKHGASATSTTVVNIGIRGGHARVTHLVPNIPEHLAQRPDTVVSMAKRFAGVSKALVFNTNNTQYSCCPVVDGCKLIGVLVGIAERPPRAPGQTDECVSAILMCRPNAKDNGTKYTATPPKAWSYC
jgi:hypothetical protein